MSAPLRSALLTIIGIFLGTCAPQTLFAQPDLYFEYQKQFENAAVGSDEQFDAKLKMIDVVFHYDLDLAIQHAGEVTELARQHGHTGAEAAGLMDHAVWTAYKFDSTKAKHLFDQATEKFDPDGNPRFVMHYLASRFGYSLINEEEEYDPNQYLDQAKAISDKLGDPHLELSYLYMAATSKVFVGKLPPTDETILPLRKRLIETSTEHDYSSGKLNAMLMDAAEASRADESLKALMVLNRTIKFARERKFRIFEVRAMLALAQVEKQMAFDTFVEQNGPVEDFSENQKKELSVRMESARARFDQCLTIARQVKMSSYVFESLIYSAFAEFHCGNVELAKQRIFEADKLPYECFRSWVMRDRLYRYAVMIFASSGDASKALSFANRLASKEHIEKAAAASDKSTRYRQLLTQEKIEKAEYVSNAEKVTSDLVVSRDAIQKKADNLRNLLFFSALALGLVGLCSALLWNRTRLKDVTSQLSNEKENVRINREMQDVLKERITRLQRMESLGMLAGGVAHDFNNLLVGVMGNAELLDSGEQLDDFSRTRVQQIIVSAEKAADLSKQMLAYAGKQQIQRRAVDINSIARNILRVLDATAGENMDVSLEIENEALVSEVDETQIEQILLNLVSNARNASESKGDIIIRSGTEKIEHVGADPLLHGTRSNGGDFVYLEVEDYGRGFSEIEMERIFEPFYSSEAGKGLGLSVVYGIVNGHDGLIRVKFDSVHGTTFRILLPKSEPVQTSIAPKPHYTVNGPIPSGARENGNILVVDDEDMVRDYCQSLLQAQGWDVALANDGIEAMELLAKSPQTFSCVLLDVVMPRAGAKEVLANLKEKGIELPIILMSGYSSTQLDVYRKDQQVVSILEKPFRSNELIRLVSETARRSSVSSRNVSN